MVKLLETTLIRIGNFEYARENNSFGLITLRNKHVRVRGAKIRFRFRGKSGIDRDIDFNNKKLAQIVRRCQELPGQELFQYIDADGKSSGFNSSDINDYLREVTGADLTAKDFRNTRTVWSSQNGHGSQGNYFLKKGLFSVGAALHLL